MTVTQRGGSHHHAEAASIENYDQRTTPAGYPWLTPYEAGWRDGYAAAVTLIAERADALDESWRPPNRRSAAEARADRLASLAPAGGVEEWLETLRQQTLRKLSFVAEPRRLRARLVAQGIDVSPLWACEWPPVAVPGGAAA